MKKISTLITLVVLLFPAFVGGQDLRLEYRTGTAAYGVGDTVVVGIRVGIPFGYHLYGNPLGPGVGKPLGLYINRISPSDSGNNIDSGIGVAWFEALKGASKKYKPPMGEWVWAYESEAYFFLRGVLNIEDGASVSGNQKIKYEAAIDALICRTACVPVEKRITFELSASSDISDKSAPAFSGAASWRARYAKSEPMDFKTGAPPPGGLIGIGNSNTPQFGINIDLSGLSTAIALAESSSVNLPFGNLSAEDGNNPNRQAEEKILIDNNGNIIWNYVPVEAKREYSLITAILFALLAGLALNLTPCIFPLLGVRILSFAESARESRRRAVVRSAAFACGIVAVFLLLAAFAAFAGFSWGQQFQNPTIMVVIIAVIFLFALGMFDFYTMAAPSVIGNAERKVGPTLFGDFLKGAAATVMATPCGGPFLGALLAWALLQKPLTIFILFAVMGVGMALPYILLSSISKLQQLLPKPGRWIEDFKHIMGFVLLLFAVNLLKSLDAGLTVTAVGICLSILCAASVNKRFAPFGSSSARRLIVILIALAMLAVGTAVSVVYLRNDTQLPNGNLSGEANTIHIIGYGSINNTQTVNNNGVQELNPIDTIGCDSINHITAVDSETSDSIYSTVTVWNDFSPYALIKAQEEGRSVIVSFTASWCTNCKLNKAAALDIPAARQIYADKKIALLTADITNHNPQAQNLLRHLGSRSVPFVAIFPSDSPRNPIIMRDILSKDKYLKVLKEL